MKKSLSHNERGRQHRPSRDLAGAMALQALDFLGRDIERLGRFFDITGLTVQTLRQAAGAPGFDASLLDYLGSDERLLCAFAAENGYDPADVDAARQSLTMADHEDRDHND